MYIENEDGPAMGTEAVDRGAGAGFADKARLQRLELEVV